MSAVAAPIIQQGLSLSDFLRTYRRWIAFSLSGLEPAFTLASFRHVLFFWVALVIGALALAAEAWIALVLAGLVVLGTTWSVVHAHERLGGAPLELRHAWVPFALLVITPLLYPTIFVRPAVDWRGRTYELDARGRLAVRGEPAVERA